MGTYTTYIFTLKSLSEENQLEKNLRKQAGTEASGNEAAQS